MDCPNRKINLEQCGCSYPGCAKKGVCCECVRYHRDNGEIPGCFFPADIEAGYDRSIANFVKINKKRGSND